MSKATASQPVLSLSEQFNLSWNNSKADTATGRERTYAKNEKAQDEYNIYQLMIEPGIASIIKNRTPQAATLAKFKQTARINGMYDFLEFEHDGETYAYVQFNNRAFTSSYIKLTSNILNDAIVNLIKLLKNDDNYSIGLYEDKRRVSVSYTRNDVTYENAINVLSNEKGQMKLILRKQAFYIPVNEQLAAANENAILEAFAEFDAM